MAKYTTNAFLAFQGEVIKAGSDIELTEEQAKYLGDKVTAAEKSESEGVYTESEFRELTADEQKAIVEGYDGDLSDLTNEDKRVAYVLEKQKAEA